MTVSEPAIYHVTHWKAGSQWVKGVLSDLFPERIVATNREMQRGVFTVPMTAGAIYSPLYINRTAFEASPAGAFQHRKFIVIRDLRDTLVSWYYSLKFSHPVNSKVEYHRPVLEGMSVDDGLLYLAEHRDFFALAMIPGTWRTSGDLIVRYEDLLADAPVGFRRILSHCGLVAEPERFAEVMERWRFEARAGRPPGRENPASQYRKGVAGDWRNYFKSRLREAFYSRYGDLLSRLGYALEPVEV